jgi:twitching motility two-component system response regulator PilH
VAILDILNRAESEYFSKVFKLEFDYFNRDLNLLFSNKVNVVQPSYDYLESAKIIAASPKKFVVVVSSWEGACAGETLLIFQVPDAKVMCGLLMMMGTDDIKETLASDFGPDDSEIFKEIANQVNGSLDNALRENFTFDFHAKLKEARLISVDEAGLEKVFPAAGYMTISAVLKMSGFPDSNVCQYLPRDMVKKVSELQGVDRIGGEKEDTDEDQKGVLIVDDDPVIRKIIKGFLKGMDLNLLDAGDGVEAMQVLIRSKVHLVIMDIEMPNMNGIETCKRIKQNPRTRNIPIVMCSSKSTRDNVLAAVNSGARDFLVKPINKKEEFQQRVLKYMCDVS